MYNVVASYLYKDNCLVAAAAVENEAKPRRPTPAFQHLQNAVSQRVCPLHLRSLALNFVTRMSDPTSSLVVGPVGVLTLIGILYLDKNEKQRTGDS